MPSSWVKDPDAVLSYTVDWSDWLATGATISTSTWVVDSGITQDSATNDGDSATITLSGGTAGTTYECVNRITTSDSLTEDRTITIHVRER